MHDSDRIRKWIGVGTTSAILLGTMGCGGSTGVASSATQRESASLLEIQSGPCVTFAAVVACPPPNSSPPPTDGGSDPGSDHADGWMTGGGSVLTSAGVRVTHGFELRCDLSAPTQNLEVNWASGHRFHLSALSQAACLALGGIDAGAPSALFNTFLGDGTGSYDDQDGASIQFVLTDAGEPGRQDSAGFFIRDASGQVVLDVAGALESGNQQAHQ